MVSLSHETGDRLIPLAESAHRFARPGQDDGNDETDDGRYQQRPFRAIAKSQQEQAQDRIQEQNVARPDEHAMNQAQNEQNRHPPRKNRPETIPFLPRPQQLNGHAPAKKERKERIEFGPDQELDQNQNHFVQCVGIGGRIETVAAEAAHIGRQNANQGKSTQNIYEYEPFLLLNGDGLGHLFRSLI